MNANPAIPSAPITIAAFSPAPPVWKRGDDILEHGNGLTGVGYPEHQIHEEGDRKAPRPDRRQEVKR